MRDLPDEIWTDILDYLEPLDIVSSQRVSPRLLKLARDSTLFRYKCYERAPSAAHSHANRPNALSALTGALGGLSLGDSDDRPQASVNRNAGLESHTRASRRATAVMEWDCTHASERIDWYSEYIARHAPLSTEWTQEASKPREVRGMALLGDERAVGPLEDGSLTVWNIHRSTNGRPSLREAGRSKEGLVFNTLLNRAESSTAKARSLGVAVDNISVDSKRMRAYVSAEDHLNEVDLERMEVISQQRYAWPITALSQERSDTDFSLTIGTSWSLHVHDPRLPLTSPLIRSADDSSRLDSSEAESGIAFLPNYTKLRSMRDASLTSDNSLFSSEGDFDSDGCGRARCSGLKSFARVEPGPQSILHRGEHEIIIAGRMPSILFYDRRSFPRLESVIHSGARLSAMTMLPVPPANVGSNSQAGATLIACGEYSGRGSLELYGLPHPGSTSFSNNASSHDELKTIAASTADPAIVTSSFKYRNRQEAASSKLLSVATQGTRIVFADAEGNLKWVERDGRGLARRWNINNYNVTDRGASVLGERVVRKMIALSTPDSERGSRGDGDLLVWTGEQIGVVTSKPRWEEVGHDELVKAFEEKLKLDEESNGEVGRQRQEAEYAKMMRQALERQADERRWMSRFGGRRW